MFTYLNDPFKNAFGHYYPPPPTHTVRADSKISMLYMDIIKSALKVGCYIYGEVSVRFV